MAAKRIIRLNTPSRFIFMRWLFEVTVFYLLICCCWRKCACATRSSLSTHTPGPGGRHWKLGNRIAHISTKKTLMLMFYSTVDINFWQTFAFAHEIELQFPCVYAARFALRYVCPKIDHKRKNFNIVRNCTCCTCSCTIGELKFNV